MTCFPAIDFLRKSRKTLARAFGQSMPKCQATSSKFQTPSSKEAPSSKPEARAVVWSLELGISLVFGAWFLVFRFWNFSGAWGLVLGVSLAPKKLFLAI